MARLDHSAAIYIYKSVEPAFLTQADIATLSHEQNPWVHQTSAPMGEGNTFVGDACQA